MDIPHRTQPLADFEKSLLKQIKTNGVIMGVDKLDDMVRAIKGLTQQQVMVGIPAENNERDDGEDINNAAIGYIQEFGVPEKNIQARPHLVPGVDAYVPRAIERFKVAANDALDGNSNRANAQLNAVGLEAVSSVRNAIDALPEYPEDSPTIYKRRHRHTKPIRMGLKALIDMGDYLRHITYVLRKTR